MNGKPQTRLQCPVCHKKIDDDLGAHILKSHGKKAFRQAILADKERGMSDVEIGKRYGISFNTLEQIVIEAYGANVSVLKRPKRIRRWRPPNFREETTTVWSFRQRGSWATHDGRYRGNWSPYIPRNVILKYSKPGDVVLDYFVGGGTTAIEAKLLGRRCIARDINPGAVGLTRENLRFSPPPWLFGDGDLSLYEPEVKVGDARDLSDIPDNSVDLICAHPPYAGIIKYSSNIAGDLSGLSVEEFLAEMGKVAEESLRVLKPGGKCAILIGDTRKEKHVVPIGFRTIRVFLEAGFLLRELVIKRQHNCKTTGFWYARSVQYNFLLLAHEYLPIFEKPIAEKVREQRTLWEHALPYQIALDKAPTIKKENLETTTVWVFPKDHLESEVRRNLLWRFAVAGGEFIEVQFHSGRSFSALSPEHGVQLLYVRSPKRQTEEIFVGYRTAIQRLVEQTRDLLPLGSFLIVEASDFRTERGLVPAGLFLWEDMISQKDFLLKEIIVVVPEESPSDGRQEHLDIVHRYLLVYSKKKD